jgi:hypothetical protein
MRAAHPEYTAPSFLTADATDIGLRLPARYGQNDREMILHRKNALFYKTENGARVGDVFMSLLHTCELNGVEPFAYLVALQCHAEAVAENPSEWLPWNYREKLAGRVAGPAPPA